MCSGQRIFFDKVPSVLPGSSLTFADGVIKTEKYWTGPQIEEVSIVNLEEIECEIRNSIAIHLIVRRQNLLDTKLPELRETLAHQVVL